MELYFAPMEGITGSIYRKAHNDIFGGIDKYYAPFLYANPTGTIGKRAYLEIAPEYNEGIKVVPQLLTNNVSDFIVTAGTLRAMGYDEININLGCPSGTVVRKYRGCGLLADPDRLDAFLYGVYEASEKERIKVSIKTRLGISKPSEFERIMMIYSKYPVFLLIIHPRVREEFYSGQVHLDVFGRTVFPALCYNGDIKKPEDISGLREIFPHVDKYMIGRGLLADPALAARVRGRGPVVNEELGRFHERLFTDYDRMLNGSIKVVSLMKEQWQFWKELTDDEGKDKIRTLMRIKEKKEYYSAAQQLINDLHLEP